MPEAHRAEAPIETHGTDLIATIANPLGAAFVTGYLAPDDRPSFHRGYLLARGRHSITINPTLFAFETRRSATAADL